MNTTAADGYVTEAQQYRARKAKGAAKRMETSVEKIENRSGRITKMALWVSTPHQMSFLLASIMPMLHWGSAQQVIESLGMAMIALSVPILCDYTILNCVETIAAPVVHRRSKIRAFVFLTITAAVSGSVNFLAPAPPLVKWLAAFITFCILMAEGLRDIREDFKRFEEIVDDIAIGTPAKPAKLVVDKNELRARKEAGYDDMTPAGKREFTRQRRARVANRAPRTAKMPELTPVQQIQMMANAPVSAAPAAR